MMKAIISDQLKDIVNRFFRENLCAYGIKLGITRKRFSKINIITIDFVDKNGNVISSFPTQELMDGEHLTLIFPHVIQENRMKWDA